MKQYVKNHTQSYKKAIFHLIVTSKFKVTKIIQKPVIVQCFILNIQERKIHYIQIFCQHFYSYL